MEKEICKSSLKDIGHAESTAEYALADYQGDIKKVLSQRARLLPVGRYTGGGEFEVAGTVEYTVLYADAENKLTTAVFASDYAFSAPIDEDRFLSASPEVKITGFSIRLGGPRRISAKCSLSCRALVSELECFKVEGDALERTEGAQMLEKKVSVWQSLNSERTEREYSDELARINAASPDEVTVIASGGSVRISEARAVEGGVLLVGTVELTAIVSTPSEAAFAVSKSIPFEEIVSLEGASEEMSAVAEGVLSSVSISVNDEGDGNISVGASALADFSAVAHGGEEFSLVCDAYNCDCESENGYSTYKYEEHIASGVMPISLSASVAREEVINGAVRGILAASPTVKLLEATPTARGINVSGELTVNGVACQENENGAEEYCNFKFTSPIDENVNINCHIPEGARLDARLVPEGVSLLLDSGKICAKCDASLVYLVTLPREIKVLASSTVSNGPAPEKRPSSVTVYFPEPTDTLWSVAKRYKTTVQDIAVANSLSESVMADFDRGTGLSSVKKLIIK